MGAENKKVVFFVNDTQIFDDAMLEDICHIMNNGEVPELFSTEEKAKLIEEMDSNAWAVQKDLAEDLNNNNTNFDFNNIDEMDNENDVNNNENENNGENTGTPQIVRKSGKKTTLMLANNK